MAESVYRGFNLNDFVSYCDGLCCIEYNQRQLIVYEDIRSGRAHSKAKLSMSKKEFLGIKQVVFQVYQTKESFLQQNAGLK